MIRGDAQGRDASAGRRLGLLFLLVAVAGVGAMIVARRWWWLPVLASAEGAEIDRLFITTLVVTGIVFVLVHLALGLFIWQGSRRREAAYWPEHRTLELTYTLIPAAILATLIAMGGMVWARIKGPPPPNALVIDVRGEQFTWVFRYPGADGRLGRIRPELITRGNPMGLDLSDPASRDDIVTRELHLIVNRPVRLRVRSKDVIHSFYLPNFRFKQDAVPGMVTEMWFTPTREGDFEAACAELCGVGHYVMRGKVKVESQPAFDAWLAQQK